MVGSDRALGGSLDTHRPQVGRWGGQGRGGSPAPHPGQRESSPTQTDASGYTQQLGTEKKELRTGKDDQVPKSHQGLGSHLRFGGQGVRGM